MCAIFHRKNPVKWLNLQIATLHYKIQPCLAGRHSVVAKTEIINHTGLHPALFILNHSVV
jgi:hypothetical protein